MFHNWQFSVGSQGADRSSSTGTDSLQGPQFGAAGAGAAVGTRAASRGSHRGLRGPSLQTCSQGGVLGGESFRGWIDGTESDGDTGAKELQVLVSKGRALSESSKRCPNFKTPALRFRMAGERRNPRRSGEPPASCTVQRKEVDSKKRKAKGKSQKKKGDDDDDSAVRTSESGVSNEAILNHLEDQHPDLPEMALRELCVEVQRHLTQMVAEAAEKLRSSLQTKQKQQFEQADKLVQERYEKLVLGLRGLRALEAAHEKQESPLYQHLLREVVLEPLHALIALRLEEATGQSVEVTAANRKQCLEKLATAEKNPPEVLQRLVAAMAKKDTKETKDSKESKDSKEGKEGKEKGKSKKGDAKDADDPDISELYHAAADDSHIFCRKVDKKREKAAAQEQQRALKERLKEATPSDALAVCHLGLQLALAAEGVSCLVLPCELWALRLAASFFHSEVSKSPEVGEQCLRLCDLCDEKGDAVEREAAAAAWRERFL
mmetsp:Transcript_48457/g.98657  ORF Transcript_48457/g.98657 Transcript_48457/m.98657 type:complete len:491 (-) Transcript_48457:9-1481(-)